AFDDVGMKQTRAELYVVGETGSASHLLPGIHALDGMADDLVFAAIGRAVRKVARGTLACCRVLRHRFNCIHNGRVTGASAEIAGDGNLYLLARRMLVCGEQFRGS